ncbi:MAG: alanine:cation symporter family protein [Firmicutes bacterium]|nr:alanine:cation symporter family protein [Bacillota bacterium]
MIINKILWAITTALIIVSGIYFTLKLNGVQFKFKDIFKSIKNDNDGANVTPFQTLSMALAGRIGVGSLAGVALSIHIGGIGSVFWMWITAFLCAPNAFSEGLLGVMYHKKSEDGIYCGGPSYYIRDGLKKKGWANLYAILIIVAYIFGFLSIQSNTITNSITNVINIKPIIIGIIITFITSLIIFKGDKGIINAASKLVPIMSVIYIGVTLFILIINIDKIPIMIIDIIKSAFNFRALGMGVLTTFIIGLQRGIFSNEAGIGTGAIASATTDTNDSVKQGLLQILGVYFTTLIICTITAFVIILSDYDVQMFNNINGIEITNYAFSYFIGDLGNITVIISIILFAFSTIVAGYYYGESNLKFFTKDSRLIPFLKIITLIILLFSSIVSAEFLWDFVDMFVAVLGIINIIALFYLRKDILKAWKIYQKNKKM